MGGSGRRQPKGLHTASWGHASTAVCGLTAPPRDAPAMCGLTAPPWDCAARRWSTLQNNGRTGRPGAGIPRGGGGGSHRRPPVRSGASGNSCRCGSAAAAVVSAPTAGVVSALAPPTPRAPAAALPAAVVVSTLAPPAPRAPALAAPGAGSAAGVAAPPTWDWHPTSSREGHASPVRCLTPGLDCPASHTPMRCLTVGLEGHASPRR